MPEIKKTAFVFSGQNSQYAGMAGHLVNNKNSLIAASSKDIFQRANKLSSYDLLGLCTKEDAPELKETEFAQPAIFTVTFAALMGLVKMDIAPTVVLGHSLGEYVALVAAGCLSFEDGLKAVKERGRIMKEVGEKNPGGMGVIVGLDIETIEKICKETGVYIANYNSPSQTVIGGEKRLIEEALGKAKLAGAKLYKPLGGVSIASHTPLMKPAEEDMKKVLDTITIKDPNPEIAFYQNTTGKRVTTAEEIKHGLLEQLTNPVQFYKALELIVESGVSEIVEVGPGSVLTDIIKRSPLVVNVDNSDNKLSKI